MTTVVITGIGLVCSLGASVEDIWQKLIASYSGIKLHQPFPELGRLPLSLIGKQPAQVRTLTQQVVSSVLRDAGLVPPLPNCGVVIGSSRSHQASWEKMARQMYLRSGREEERESAGITEYPDSLFSGHSPIAWLDNLPHMNAIAAARQIGATGVVLAPMAACATGIWAIAQAALLIQSGQCQQVIAGAVEAPITPLSITGFQQIGALAKTGAYPFDRQREGLVLGEGAAVFVLESAESALQRQAKIYGQILGCGLTADAYHVTSIEPEGRSAIAAVKQCLLHSHLNKSHIDYIHAHGTATLQNDRVESSVIQRLFTQSVAVSSTKGATGHTLGASGAVGIAFTLMALKHQILPPCVGLKQPEFDLDLVKTARESQIQHALCFSFGFGGQNAVVALSQY
ncbi:MAG: beta-ketoacyl-ACP synthase [Rhizonema sp. PD37]|nr:beta-ketoacyl-ACP synthase [Rhizonema sp. PD37]